MILIRILLFSFCISIPTLAGTSKYFYGGATYNTNHYLKNIDLNSIPTENVTFDEVVYSGKTLVLYSANTTAHEGVPQTTSTQQSFLFTKDILSTTLYEINDSILTESGSIYYGFESESSPNSFQIREIKNKLKLTLGPETYYDLDGNKQQASYTTNNSYKVSSHIVFEYLDPANSYTFDFTKFEQTFKNTGGLSKEQTRLYVAFTLTTAAGTYVGQFLLEEPEIKNVGPEVPLVSDLKRKIGDEIGTVTVATLKYYMLKPTNNIVIEYN